MTDQPELKPCPKCGYIPRVWYFENEKYWSVKCIGSERQTGYIDHSFETTGKTEEDAIAAWNNRVEPIGNSEELPEWMRKEIDFEVYRLKLYSDDETYYIEDRVQCDVAARKLEWVLSLKKPEKE